MKPRTLPTRPDRARLAWNCIARTCGMDARLATIAWQAIARSNHPDAQLLRFSLASLLHADAAVRDRRMFDLGHRVITPQRVIALLENAVLAGWMTRQDANAAMDKLLAHVHGGSWFYLYAEQFRRQSKPSLS